MKKHLVIVSIYLLLISCGPPKLSSVSNFKVQSAKVILNDESTKEAMVEFPVNSSESKLRLKNGKETEKIEKENIKKIVYTTSTGPIELENFQVYKNARNAKISKKKKLLCLSAKGKVNLYFSQGSGWQQRGNMQVPVYFTEYYCKRDNENVASLIHIDMNVINKNVIFKYAAKRYFADDQVLVSKIENKEYTYKNIIEMITYYNSK